MNIKQVKVSLIICGYNAEATLPPTLDSAMAQTLDALEILCVNDGSKDKTLEIYRAYAEKDPRIKVIDLPQNKGLLAARKAGVNAAAGKYIMFLDGDDFLVPEACAELSQLMDETNSDMIQFDTFLVFESEEERLQREKVMEKYFSFKRSKPLYGSDNILKSCFLEKEFAWNVWSKIYKAELARKVSSYVPEDMRVVMAEDTFGFFVAASLAEKLTFSPKKYYKYSVGCGVSGSNKLSNEIRSLDVYYNLIKPYVEKQKSSMVREVYESLGKHFRGCACSAMRLHPSGESLRETLLEMIRQFGFSEVLLIFLENWSQLGAHPARYVFWEYGAKFPANKVKKIRNIGLICPDGEFTESLQDLLKNLQKAGYEPQLLAEETLLQKNKDIITCKTAKMPLDPERMFSFFASPSLAGNDAYIIFHTGEQQDYNVLIFSLFLLRYAKKIPVFSFLEKDSPLHLYDKILMGSSDCVLTGKMEHAELFGKEGLLSKDSKKSSRLKEVISLFEKSSGKDPARSITIRRNLDRILTEALDGLGVPGFWRKEPINRADVEQTIASCGSPITLEDYIQIRESGLFDDEYYRSQFPDTVMKDPICHFCSIGVFQLASPSAAFHVKHYCMGNPDLFPVKGNLLLHYLHHGIAECRKIYHSAYDVISRSGYFNENLYKHEHGEELGTLDALTHYLLIGWRKEYVPSEFFVDQYYRGFYLEFDRMLMPPLHHYVLHGKTEGRCAFPLTPRLEYHFPEGFDKNAFWKREEKYLIAVHQLDFTGVPILGRMIAEIFLQEECAGIISPMDGPLRENCLKAGVPVFIDSAFFLDPERVAYYKGKGFKVCLFNTLGLLRSFLRTVSILPSVLWIHENDDKDFLPKDLQEMIKFAPTVFATSKYTTDLVKGYNPAVRYLPYPIKDMGKDCKKDVPEKIRFGVFGTYYERKGQDLVIEAFTALPAELKEKAELFLIGNGASPEFVRKLESMAENEKNIHFMPAVKDQASYHKLYDDLEVQICPSRTDPMPLVVFDGMMHGCPLILSDTVGQSVFVEEGKNGYVFPAEDVKALTNCMEKMIENRASFPEFSKEVRELFLNNFEFSKASCEIRKVFNEVKNYL